MILKFLADPTINFCSVIISVICFLYGCYNLKHGINLLEINHYNGNHLAATNTQIIVNIISGLIWIIISIGLLCSATVSIVLQK